MKNNLQSIKHSGNRLAWQRKMVKVRNAVRSKHKQVPVQLQPVAPKTSENYVVEDLANHKVETVEYDYYMDSYS
ncbi:MAG: hypothetical protein MJZ67_01530 [Bacteroidales bacterium]|nr:hypothetical protein [Bacteroidales bacterium]